MIIICRSLNWFLLETMETYCLLKMLNFKIKYKRCTVFQLNNAHTKYEK